jgi:ribosomal protein L11 methyltransferase
VQWLEVKVVTGRESTEAVSEKLIGLGAGGVSVHDELDWATAKRAGLGEIFPDLPAADNGLITIRGYFPLSFLEEGKEEELQSFLLALPSFGLAPAVFSATQLNDPDWEQAWKQYWEPTPAGNKLMILPAWLDALPWPGRLVLRLDPGAAFGTGTHESTQLCLELLETVIAGGESVCDLGCGSGILALAAKLLGASKVSGVDNDEAAIRAARENAELNGMQLPFIRADLFSEKAWSLLNQADLVTANLTADALLTVCSRLRHVLFPGGRLIISGIVRHRQGEVLAAYLQEGYQLKEKRSAGEWVALLLELK